MCGTGHDAWRWLHLSLDVIPPLAALQRKPRTEGSGGAMRATDRSQRILGQLFVRSPLQPRQSLVGKLFLLHCSMSVSKHSKVALTLFQVLTERAEGPLPLLLGARSPLGVSRLRGKGYIAQWAPIGTLFRQILTLTPPDALRASLRGFRP